MTMNSKLSWVGAALALAGVASGCGVKSVDIGDNDPPAVTGATLADYEGTWEGYAELATWNDGTDVIRLVLDDNGNGVIEVGNADPLPPPVYGEVYPPGEENQFIVLQPMLVSGFSFAVSGATVESKRIRLASSSSQLYAEWCSLFTPGPIEGGYNCVGGTSFTGDGNGLCTNDGDPEAEAFNCDILACFHMCTCDEASCDVTAYGNDIRLDAALEMEGEELEGSFETPAGRFFVRMTRQ